MSQSSRLKHPVVILIHIRRLTTIRHRTVKATVTPRIVAARPVGSTARQGSRASAMVAVGLLRASRFGTSQAAGCSDAHSLERHTKRDGGGIYIKNSCRGTGYAPFLEGLLVFQRPGPRSYSVRGGTPYLSYEVRSSVLFQRPGPRPSIIQGGALRGCCLEDVLRKYVSGCFEPRHHCHCRLGATTHFLELVAVRR